MEEKKSVDKKKDGAKSGKAADFMKLQTRRCLRAIRAILVGTLMAFISFFVVSVVCTVVFPMSITMLIQLVGVGYESNILDVILVLILPGLMLVLLYTSLVKALLSRLGRWMWNLWVGPKIEKEVEKP